MASDKRHEKEARTTGVYVARFTNNPAADIDRGWSGWMGEGYGTEFDALLAFAELEAYELIERYEEDEITESEFVRAATELVDVRFDAACGLWRRVHHSGLSCFTLDAETESAARMEAATLAASGKIAWSGFGHATGGEVRHIGVIDHSSDLHLFECEFTSPE